MELENQDAFVLPRPYVFSLTFDRIRNRIQWVYMRCLEFTTFVQSAEDIQVWLSKEKLYQTQHEIYNPLILQQYPLP